MIGRPWKFGDLVKPRSPHVTPALVERVAIMFIAPDDGKYFKAIGVTSDGWDGRIWVLSISKWVLA